MKQKPSSRRRHSSTKSILRLPDLEHAKAAVLNMLNLADPKRGYRHANDEFVDWYCSEPRLAFKNSGLTLSFSSRIPSTRTRHYQSASWRRASAIRSRRLRSSQRRFGCRHSSGKRGEEAGHVLWGLVNGGARPCALASTRSSATERKTRPGLRIGTRVWVEEA